MRERALPPGPTEEEIQSAVSFGLYLANRFRASRLAQEYAAVDLESWVLLTVAGCAARYDRTRGVKFLSFAGDCVQKGLTNALRDWAHLPRDRWEERAKTSGGLEQQYLPPLSLEMVAAERDKPIRLGEMIRDPHDAGNPERVLADAGVDEMLSSLEPREQAILRGRYVEELPQWQIGERLGISQMHVSRLEKRALAKLRKQFGAPAG